MNNLAIVIVFSTVSFVSPIQASPITKEKALNLTSDSFEVIEEVGRRYAREFLRNRNYIMKLPFGLSFESNSNEEYPKAGFVGFEVWEQGKLSLLKLQLMKDEFGWRVENVLPNDQINDAHPLSLPKVGHVRTDETAIVNRAAALKFESDSITQGIIGDVRSTTSRCYLAKNLQRASCTITYGIHHKQDNGRYDENTHQCLTSSYLMSKASGQWMYERDIEVNQQVDFTSGQLQEKKIYPPHCN